MAPNIIPLPGSTKGKQNTTVRGPRKNYERVETALRNEVKDYTEMDNFFGELCDVNGGDNTKSDCQTNINIGDSDQKVGSELEVTNSSREEPDDFDIEMAKAEEEGVLGEQAEQTFQIPGLPIFNPGNTEGAGRQTKRKRESTISLDSPTFDLPGDLDHDQKRRALAGQWNSPVGEEGRDRQTKRKRESGISAESPGFDLPGEIDHDQKRKKLKTGTKSSQAPPAGPQDKGSEKANAELGPCDLFCLGTTVGDVFQAMKAVGGLENPQEDSTDVKLIIAGVLYPTEGQHDIRVAKAAANLEIDQGASNVPGLDPADRDALKEVFGEPDKLQPSEDKEKEPSAFVTFPRKVKYHERYSVNKSLLRQHRYTNMFKRVKKPTQPSEKFLSFFATRRQREVLLHKGEDLWDEEDASFIRSGEEIAEPGARLGAEFVAKRLLEVRDLTSLSPNGIIC